MTLSQRNTVHTNEVHEVEFLCREEIGEEYWLYGNDGRNKVGNQANSNGFDVIQVYDSQHHLITFFFRCMQL